MAKRGGYRGGPHPPPPPAAPAPPPTEGAPTLEPTIASIEAYTAWALGQLDAGMCEPRVHDGRNKSIAEMRKTLALKHNLAELEELRRLVKTSADAVERRKKNESDDRYGQGADAPPFGRVPLKT